VRVDRSDPDFGGWVLALGRVGIVVALTLDVVPTVRIAQTVVERVPDEQVVTNLASIMAAAYSVSLFTDWGPRAESHAWLKELDGRSLAGERWGGTPAERPHNPVAGMPPENATEQFGRPGPWHERLPHFRLEFTPSSGDELQTEYLVPMTHASAAWEAVDAIRDVLHPLLHVCEFRAVAPDPMWLSLTGGKLSLAVHFTWRPDNRVAEAVAAVEKQLSPYDARPHWGKVFSVTPERLERLYPRMVDFRRLVADVDPDGTFGNDQVDGWIGLDRRH
jgi:xylitol oxidase